MENLTTLQEQINDINKKRIKIQTLKEQAQKQCEIIEQKYGVKSLQELKDLVDKAQEEYNQQVQLAQDYISKTNQQLSQYTGII